MYNCIKAFSVGLFIHNLQDFTTTKTKFKLHRLTHMFTSIKTGNHFSKLQPRNFFFLLSLLLQHIFHSRPPLIFRTAFMDPLNTPLVPLIPQKSREKKITFKSHQHFTDYNLNRVKKIENKKTLGMLCSRER